MTSPSARALSDFTEILWGALSTEAAILPAADVGASLSVLSNSEVCALHVLRWPGSRAVVHLWPDAGPEAAMEEATERHAMEHPLLRHYLTTGDLSVLAPQDVDPAWRHGWVWAFLKEQVGVTEQVALPVSWRQGVLSTFVVGRANGEYTPKDREALAWAHRALVSVDSSLHRFAECRRHVHAIAGGALAPATDTDGDADADAEILSPREAEVLRAVAGGQSRRVAARELAISPRTVDKHLERINNKLGTSSLVQAVNRYDALRMHAIALPAFAREKSQ